MAEQEINVALESSVEDVKSSIGATGNTGGSTTAGTIFGKLNKIIADLASHISSWTSTRAGYIDTINTNAARLTSARATKIDNIGASGDTGGSTTAGTVMGKLNAVLSATSSSNISHGSAIYTTPGTYSWTCPEGVYVVTAEIVSGSGGGGGGGGGGGAGAPGWATEQYYWSGPGGGGGAGSGGGAGGRLLCAIPVVPN
jgi:hypothetical protein